MAKQTGQITVLKNNTVTNVEHQIRFIFMKENGERITRDTTAKGVINFDIPNGDWNVSWFAVDGDQKVLPLRAGLQLKITSSTPATALADWIYGGNTHVADPILTQWTNVLDEMKSVRDRFRDETSFVGNINGKILKEGAGGILSNASPPVPSGHDMHKKLPNGLYRLPAGLINSVEWQRSGDSGIMNGWGNGYWSFLVMGTNGDMALISSNNGNVREANTFLGTKNTTTDSNGNIKSASPIIKLFDDKIEHNDSFREEPIFEKLDTGVYKISNTLGLAKEGWYIETPKDKNGLPYFLVDWEQDEESHDVIIRVFKKKLDLETLDFVNGEPVDIGEEQRWIDLRFHEEELEDEELHTQLDNLDESAH